MRKHEFTDEQWELVGAVLPALREGGRGRKLADRWQMLNGRCGFCRPAPRGETCRRDSGRSVPLL